MFWFGTNMHYLSLFYKFYSSKIKKFSVFYFFEENKLNSFIGLIALNSSRLTDLYDLGVIVWLPFIADF